MVISPQEKTPCEATELGTVNESVPAARDAGGSAARATRISTRKTNFVVVFIKEFLAD